MGVDDRDALTQALALSYGAEYNKACSPQWAFQDIAPAIPYIGERFLEAPKKVLIYASAENLACDPTHRRVLEAWRRPKQIERAYHGGQLPDGMRCVMIEPITNGSLLMAARHALHKYDADLSFSRASAEDFLEEVTVANPSKFTIAGDANIDPAKKAMYWPPSKPYIVADLDLIKPDIIIVPRTILSKLSGRKVGLGASLRSFTILPNWQITSRTVRNARRVVPGKNLSKIELSPFSIWKLTRGAERWGMEYYLQWLDVIAKDWKQMSAVS